MGIIKKLGITPVKYSHDIMRAGHDIELHFHAVRKEGGTSSVDNISRVHSDNSEVDARVHSASPEMLEALIEALMVFEDAIDDGYFVSISSLSKADKMMRAVEKATDMEWDAIKELT